MPTPIKYLNLAAELALKKAGQKNYRFGALGIRDSDGVLVQSVNGNPSEPEPKHHCEARLTRKLTPGSLVFLARVNAQGEWLLSRPCPNCRAYMKSNGINKVFYTMMPGEYGVMILNRY
jgi:hypothetical protein